MWRRPFVLALVSLLSPALFAALPANAAAHHARAVSYQVNRAHSGFVHDPALAPPLVRKWRLGFGRPVSYPLLAERKVFVSVADLHGHGTHVYAIDASTGSVLWRVAVRSSYPWSAIAYDARRVFAVSSDGRLMAIAAGGGAVEWAVDLPGQSLFTSPPTAGGGLVFVLGAGVGGTLYAVDETTGELRWMQPTSSGFHSSPALSRITVYVSCDSGAEAFDRAAGTERWADAESCGPPGTTSVYHARRLYARADSMAFAREGDDGRVLDGFGADVAPAFAGHLGLFLFDGELRATDVRTDATAWTFSGDGRLDSAPIVVDDVVYEGSASGALYALSTSSGRVVWHTNVGGRILPPDEYGLRLLTGLAAGEGMLVVPTKKILVAYGPA
jgi:outer membrane protein assembly factor BamB